MLYQPFYQDLMDDLRSDKPFSKWSNILDSQLHDLFVAKPHGDMGRWQTAYEALPEIKPVSVDLTCNSLLVEGNINTQQSETLKASLQRLMPWRKGPFQFFDCFVDTEWRSDWKWQRVLPHLSPLTGRTILDVGCGSGYHMWRMLGEGAHRVIGVDPTKLFFWQFEAAKKYVKAAYGEQAVRAHFLPMKMESVPPKLNAFDTVFSMGVLYHRRSPLDHLSELYGTLKKGGELVLETLVIDGDLGEVLMPEDRYAMMRNVWFLPTTKTLSLWLRRTGFQNIRVVDENYTTTNEQRSTQWMGFDSLNDFLDKNDPKKTAEGYPAPLRATLIANT